MKQRLGLAQALLGDPELVVLDEPTNGLDPAGIHEVRDLVRSLPNRCGATVFLSSHLLSEVEQVATHLAIISAGHLMFEGTREDLRARNKPTLIFEVDRPAGACELLERLGCTAAREGNSIRVTAHGDYGPAEINAALVHAGMSVSQLVTEHASLEDFFLELTCAPEGLKEYA